MLWGRPHRLVDLPGRRDGRRRQVLAVLARQRACAEHVGRLHRGRTRVSLQPQ